MQQISQFFFTWSTLSSIYDTPIMDWHLSRCEICCQVLCILKTSLLSFLDCYLPV